MPADAKVLEGSIEVNESLLTGESDNLQKNEGDELFSGSFVTSGEACCQVIHVGKENYASQITSEAKEFKRHNSELAQLPECHFEDHQCDHSSYGNAAVL